MSSKIGFLGVDLGGTNVRAALLNKDGEIVYRAAHQHGSDKTPSAILENTKTVISSVLNHETCRSYEVISLGIGVPGSVDNRGVIIKAPNLGWENVDFKNWLCQEYQFTVTLANDITMAIWGEYCFGGAKGYQDVIFISLGTGVGGGIILDGKLFTGRSDSSVEVGHMVMEAGGELCGCGNRGCWETIVSGSALKRRAIQEMAQRPESLLHKLAQGKPEQVQAGLIYEAYKLNDPLAVELWRRFLKYLAAGINNILVIFNPQLLILGGGVTAGVPRLVEELRAALKETIKIIPFDPKKIINSQLGEDAGLVGAAFYGRKYGQN